MIFNHPQILNLTCMLQLHQNGRVSFLLMFLCQVKKISEILTDIFSFIDSTWCRMQAERQHEHAPEYPLLRCLSDEQLSEVEVSSRKNRLRQKLQRVPREMEINFRVI